MMNRASSSAPSLKSKAKALPYPDEDAVTRQMLVDDDNGLFSKPLTKKQVKELFDRQKVKKAK
ncbi:MAG: hypothetical protein PSX71_14110 [bacterium]|nr:hypothetical protein [bacterium]